jgi:hypothetical protein
MRSAYLIALGAVLAVAAPAGAQGFDRPQATKVVDFGPSPYYPPARHARNTLTCWYFREVMVKQYDDRQKGAAWLAFVASRGEKPPCAQEHPANEKVLERDAEKPEWIGYFLGVKGSLVFFNSDDTDVTGGMWFAVFDAKSGKKRFEDSAYERHSEDKKGVTSPFDEIRVVRVREGDVTLTYLRIVDTECDLREHKTCWQAARERFGLRQVTAPICRRAPNQQATVLAYPVEVVLSATPIPKPIDGPVRCWAAM